MKQFDTLRFLADAKGQVRKNQTLAFLTSRGWRVTSESIEQGNFKGQDACCLAMICLPLGFAAGHEPNVAVVNIERDAPETTEVGPHEHAWVILDDNRVMCTICGIGVARGDQWRHNISQEQITQECKNCGTANSRTAETCAYCGQPITRKRLT